MALHSRSSSGFWRRLLVYSVFSISGGLIYWYTVDWRTYKDGVAIVRAVPAGLLLFAQAIDWLGFPWSSAGHASLRRVADLDPGPRTTAWQLSIVLLYS